VDEYKKYLKQDQTNWLLEKNNPSVRYFALKDLLDLEETNPKVIDAKKRIMHSKAVKTLLADQHKDGHWGQPGWCMHPPNTSGRLWLLADIGADKAHPQIKKAVDYLLDSWLHEIYYDKSRKPIRIKMGYPEDWGFGPCMHGWSLFAFLRLGDFSDERIQKIINWVVKYVRFDDGDRVLPPTLQNSKLCQGKHTCIWGTIAILAALAEIPEKKRSRKVQKVINRGVEYILKHNINRRSHDLSRFLNPKLNQLGVSSDFVTILTALTKFGCYDKRMHDAVRYLIKKQTKDGKWKFQQSTDRSMIFFGKKGESSKWVTLRAMIALKRFFSLNVSPNFAL
jgi:hypothetical protein